MIFDVTTWSFSFKPLFITIPFLTKIPVSTGFNFATELSITYTKLP
jgi:hypothetical protein